MQELLGLKYWTSQQLMRFTEINVDDIEIGEYYNKKICLTLNKAPLKFQIPRMYMPFGISGFTPEVGPTKWNIDFNMNGWDQEDNYVKRFHDFVKSLENRVIEHVSDLFGKDMSSNFNSNVKQGPKFRVKVPDNMKVFNVNDDDVTTTLQSGLYSKHSGVAMVELSGVYFLNKMFGFTWKAYQLKTYEPQRLKGFQFNIDEEEGEVEERLSGFKFI